jgi:hypothetical protein
MRWQQFLIDGYQQMSQELEKVLTGLTLEDIKKRPSPGANPIGWLCWHTVRSCDRLLGDAVLGEQLWISQGWHKKFNRPPDFNDTGFGYTNAQVDDLNIPDVKTLLDYNRAVIERLLSYLEGVTEEELDREAPNSQNPGTTRAVHFRLIGVLTNLEHVGQAAYARGIIKGQGWYGR